MSSVVFSAPPYSPAQPVTKALRVHSCVLCQQRKVKCDRKNPCSGCIKAGVDCVSSAPAPPRRRKRKLPNMDLHAKLRRYEELLKSYGVKLEDSDLGGAGPEMEYQFSEETTYPFRRRSIQSSSTRKDSSPGIEGGRPNVDQGMRFLDHNLWTGLGDEFQDPREMLLRSDEDEKYDSSTSDGNGNDGGALLLGQSPSVGKLSVLHPQPVQIFRLWQTFLDNVNPLSKIFHAPTVQHQILEASGNLDKVSKGLQALMFSIYATAVTSLSDEDCDSMMGEPRSTLLARYSAGAQQALVKAGFLKSSDPMVLQAFVLFLFTVRQHYDPKALWVLTGVAMRIGQRLGLHRDGSSTGLSVFEAEMGRRLWWQIFLLDGRSAQLSGSAALAHQSQDWDTRIPSNFNDSDLSPEMTELPLEHTGVTEMIFCLIRYEFGEWLRRTDSTGVVNMAKLSSPAIPIAEKDKTIDELENIMESKYLRYCDPLIPLHSLSAAVARSMICKLRLATHHPRQLPDKGVSMSREEKDMLFSTSLKMVEYDSLGQSTKSMKRFLWHINVHFQLDAFVFMLSELRVRTSGQLADKAWEQIQEVYDNHPEIINDRSNALYVAVGRLTVRAWEQREAELARQYQRQPDVPNFIMQLQSFGTSSRSRRATSNPSKHDAFRGSEANGAAAEHYNGHQEQGGLAFPASDGAAAMNGEVLTPDMNFEPLPMEMSPMDWDYWSDLLQGAELQVVDGSGQNLFD